MTRGIVLVGAPGSGKATIGLVLAEQYSYRYIDREARLLERYGSRDAFLAVRDQAVAELQQDAREWMASAPTPWIYESTALTERAFIEELLGDGAYGVRLEVSEAVAVQRVAARAAGANFSNDLDLTRRIWAACVASHASLPFAFRVATDESSPQQVAAQLHAAFTSHTA